MNCATTFSARLQRIVQSIANFFLFYKLWFFFWRFRFQLNHLVETLSVQNWVFLTIFLDWRMQMTIASLMLNLIPLCFKHTPLIFSCFLDCLSEHRCSIILIVVFGYPEWLALLGLIFDLTDQCHPDLTPVVLWIMARLCHKQTISHDLHHFRVSLLYLRKIVVQKLILEHSYLLFVRPLKLAYRCFELAVRILLGFELALRLAEDFAVSRF